MLFRTPIYAHCKSDLTETTSIPQKNLIPLAARILQPWALQNSVR